MPECKIWISCSGKTGFFFFICRLMSNSTQTTQWNRFLVQHHHLAVEQVTTSFLQVKKSWAIADNCPWSSQTDLSLELKKKNELKVSLVFLVVTPINVAEHSNRACISIKVGSILVFLEVNSLKIKYCGWKVNWQPVKQLHKIGFSKKLFDRLRAAVSFNN